MLCATCNVVSAPPLHTQLVSGRQDADMDCYLVLRRPSGRSPDPRVEIEQRTDLTGTTR